jgi:hypothetical protein
MTRTRLGTLAIAAAAAMPFASCASASGDGARSSADGGGEGLVAYESRTLERSTGGCPESVTGVCAEVALEYPEILDAPTPAAEERLRAVVEVLLLGPAPFVETAEDPEQLAREFLAHQAEVSRSYPEGASTHGWFLERRVEVPYQDADVFSLSVSESWYSGGAHPNSSRTQASFDPRTGRRLLLEDLVPALRVQDLVDLAERRFRESRDIPADQLLSEAGFTFPQEAFHVNDNFAVTVEGLAFHFDPYEVGPYALGPTDYVLSRADLAPLALEGGPFAQDR